MGLLVTIKGNPLGSSILIGGCKGSSSYQLRSNPLGAPSNIEVKRCGSVPTRVLEFSPEARLKV